LRQAVIAESESHPGLSGENTRQPAIFFGGGLEQLIAIAGKFPDADVPANAVFNAATPLHCSDRTQN
jgi:hypothetical protein